MEVSMGCLLMDGWASRVKKKDKKITKSKRHEKIIAFTVYPITNSSP